MSATITLVFCAMQIALSLPAPIQMFVPQDQLSIQLMQQQLQELQNGIDYQIPPQMFYPQAPQLMIYPLPLPNLMHTSSMQNAYYQENLIENKPEQNELNTLENNDADPTLDDDSVVIESDPMGGPLYINPLLKAYKPTNDIMHTRKFILLVPNGKINGRLSINSIITSIPFLPFEVNVPDTIGWAWNGISSIISGMMQRWPFRPRPQATTTVAPITASVVEATTSSGPTRVKLLNRSPEPLFGSDVRLEAEKAKDDREIVEVPVPVFVIPVSDNYI